MKKVEIILEKIMREREQQRLSEDEMAIHLNVDKRTYNNYENGITKLTLETYLGICEILKKEYSFFLDDNKHINQSHNEGFILGHISGTFNMHIYKPEEESPK